ncbi:MAG: sugar phosphate isomerase/epimerase, partial [Lentisphaerae bacterium]|nr:sugar phosphate isomerase/epimerase [Lentisphaerota bacterium]
MLAKLASRGCQKQIGICLDTGHLHLTGGAPAAIVREAGDNLIALHLADNLGKDDNHLFPFAGTITWGPFLDALRASPYTGLFNFEVPGERI